MIYNYIEHLFEKVLPQLVKSEFKTVFQCWIVCIYGAKISLLIDKCTIYNMMKSFFFPKKYFVSFNYYSKNTCNKSWEYCLQLLEISRNMGSKDLSSRSDHMF